jgi:hypothetical protein
MGAQPPPTALIQIRAMSVKYTWKWAIEDKQSYRAGREYRSSSGVAGTAWRPMTRLIMVGPALSTPISTQPTLPAGVTTTFSKNLFIFFFFFNILYEKTKTRKTENQLQQQDTFNYNFVIIIIYLPFERREGRKKKERRVY